MKLVRYALRSSATLTPQSIEHLISLNAGEGTLDFKRGRFLTNDLYSVASSAHDYCSLTYYPSFRYLLDLPIPSSEYSLYNNRKKPLAGESEREELTRTWPAFGSHGGAHELILDHNQEIELKTTEELQDGGARDAYYYDNVQPYTLGLVQAIANGVFSAVSREEVFRVVGGKINDSGGTVLAWTRRNRLYSISVANKCFGGLWKLKFWGYTWVDDEAEAVRRCFGPYTERLEFGPCLVVDDRPGQPDLCGESARIMKAKLENRPNSVYARVDGCVRHIMKRLSGISDTLFDLDSQKVPLQTVEA